VSVLVIEAKTVVEVERVSGGEVRLRVRCFLDGREMRVAWDGRPPDMVEGETVTVPQRIEVELPAGLKPRHYRLYGNGLPGSGEPNG
jgi:hypothetical protein